MSSKIRSFLLDFETDEVGKLARKNAKNKEALIKAFSDTSDIVRERALIAAIDLADPEVVTDVSKALTDDVQDVRIAAAQALAFYQQPRTIPVLFRGLQDDDPVAVIVLVLILGIIIAAVVAAVVLGYRLLA